MSSRFRGASFSGGNSASFANEGVTGGARPLGAGKGAIRSQMQGQGFSLRDRMAARRADKALTQGSAPAPQNMGSMMQPQQSRLDASPTPGLDKQNLGTIRYNTKQGRMDAQREATKRSALSGAFGKRSQKKAENLKGRQELFKQMQTVGGANISESMQAQADKLGIDRSRFRQVAGTLSAAPGMVAKPVTPATPSKYDFAQGKQPANAAPKAPEQGKALAKRNIATKGIQGAAADYFQRRDNEMLAKQAKGIDTAMAKPQAYQGNPTSKPSRAGAAAPAPSRSRSPITSPAAPTAPTMSMSNPPQPASGAATARNDNFGQANMNWTPRDNRQSARDAVASSKAKGAIPDYQDRMQAGFVSGSELVAPVKNVANQIGRTAKNIGGNIASGTRKGVQSARNLQDRTNAWATDFRSGKKTKDQTASAPTSRFRNYR